MIKTRVFTQNFVHKWRSVIREHCFYDQYKSFFIIPSLSFADYITYLPLLHYTDRLPHEIADLLDQKQGFGFQIRLLNPEYCDFRHSDMVAMRLDITSHCFENVIAQLSQSFGNTMHTAMAKYSWQFGNSLHHIDQFYRIYQIAMHHQGMPTQGIGFFQILLKVYEDNVCFYTLMDNDAAVGTACVVFDERIAWVLWDGFTDNNHDPLKRICLYSKCIEDATKNRKRDIFDFGQSQFASPECQLFAKFGAVPVKIDWYGSHNRGGHGKLGFFSIIWRKLPFQWANTVGPLLARYLIK